MNIINKKLLYYIPAKGLGDFLVRLDAINYISFNYQQVILVAPKSCEYFIRDLPNVDLVDQSQFSKDKINILSTVDLVIYASRDHSIKGIIKHFPFFIIFKFLKGYRLYLPSILYVSILFQSFFSEIPKSQQEFYIHQVIQVLSRESRKCFIFTKSKNLLLKIYNLEKIINDKKEKQLREKIKKKQIIIFPSAKFFYQIWPFYIDLIKFLLSSRNFKVSVIANKENEILDYKQFQESSDFKLLYSLDFDQLKTEINKSDLTITNDSGPKHLMSYLKKDHISIDGYFSSWSTFSYSSNCISILSSGFSSKTFFSKKRRYQSLNYIDPYFLLSVINKVLN